MKLIRNATAGTLESSDIMVSIMPAEQINIEVESVVGGIFGDAIYDCINKKLGEMGVQGAKVFVNDKGALDCVICARIEAAVLRAAKEE